MENYYFRKVKNLSAKFIFHFIIVLFFINKASAKDKIVYGFERLGIHDYFGARESFLEAIKKQPVPACYGLSVISSSNNNPFYNLDSARVYILKSEADFRHLTPSEEEQIKTKYNIDAFKINL